MKDTDCRSVTIAEVDSGPGEVPGDMGIGGGDYVEVAWCLDCGQLQGKWPLPACELEKDGGES